MNQQLLDVLAVDLDSQKVRLIAESKTERNAEAIISMAVVRRGVESEFFASAPSGMYHEGDDWRGSES